MLEALVKTQEYSDAAEINPWEDWPQGVKISRVPVIKNLGKDLSLKIKENDHFLTLPHHEEFWTQSIHVWGNWSINHTEDLL